MDKKLEYDIVFVLPCVLNIKEYRNRIDIFKKYGLLNTSGIALKLVLLVGNDEDINGSILEGWDYEIEIIKTPFVHESAKTYWFFSQLSEEYVDKNKWLVKIDDDSITNVKKLLRDLNKDLDYNDECYVIGNQEVFLDLGKRCRKLLRQFHMDKYLSIGFWVREREMSIMSRAALKKMISDEKSISFLREASIASKNSYVNGVKIDVHIHNDDLLCPLFYELDCKIEIKAYGTWYPQWDSFKEEIFSHIHFIYKMPSYTEGSLDPHMYVSIKAADAKKWLDKND